MMIKKTNCLLLFAVMLQFNLFGQIEVRNNCQFTVDAITKAVNQFHQQRFVGFNKHMVICMKIFKLNDRSGEFVLKSIYNDDDYSDLHPTHYIRVNNELVLIKVDRNFKINPDKYGLKDISEDIKNEALDILYGPNGFFLNETTPYMWFKYKKKSLTGQYFDYLPRPPKRILY